MARRKIHKTFDAFLKERPESFRDLASMVHANVLTLRRWRSGESEPQGMSKVALKAVLGFDWDAIKSGAVKPPKPGTLRKRRNR